MDIHYTISFNFSVGLKIFIILWEKQKLDTWFIKTNTKNQREEKENGGGGSLELNRYPLGYKYREAGFLCEFLLGISPLRLDLGLGQNLI